MINAEEKKINGITIKLKGLLSGKMFIPLDSIQGLAPMVLLLKKNSNQEIVRWSRKRKFWILLLLFGTLLESL